MRSFYQILSLISFIFLMPLSGKASHLFGADFYYQHVSGNTYTLILDVYGDCAGSTFPSLSTSAPVIDVYDNSTFYQRLNLSITGPGVEVTPVCPAEVNNTTCKGGTIPGVMKFTYSAQVTLSGPSANWLFRFMGDFGNNTLSGRSNSMTNIVVPGTGSIMILEATLNNTVASNSSVNYTTIPTPFFCINIPTQYNPGAVDPNNDNITVNLVPGLEPAGTVTYINPYTATQPLAAVPGTFSFNNTTGQLSFTPNLVQKSLVVYRVEEYRNGVPVGTSMREMTFVVLNNCNNNAPVPGVVSNLVNATQTGPTTVQVCDGTNGDVSFTVTGGDADGDNVFMSHAGLPAGANGTVAANGSLNPQFSFTWNVTGVPQGNYTFYLTLKDNGCPLASTQTYAYTISIVPFNDILNAGALPGCIGQNNGMIWVHPQGTNGFDYTWRNAAGQVIQQSNADNNGDTVVNLGPGIYTVYMINQFGCDTILTITVPTAGYVVNFQTPNGICLNTPSTFQNTSSNNFSSWAWDFGDGNSSTLMSPSHTYTQQGSYTVKLVGYTANGCADSISKQVMVEEVVVDIQIADDTICEGSQTLMIANGAASYVWSPSTSLSCPACAQTIAFPANTITYSVVGTSAVGCTGTDSVTLFILNTGLDATPNDTGVCPGDSLQLHVTGFDSLIRWFPSQGLSDTSAHPWVHPKGALSYSVVAYYKNGCTDTEYIHVRYVSDAVITMRDSVTLYPGESYQMDPDGNCLYFHWFPPTGLNSTTIADPVAQPIVNTRYFVTGTTEWGCITVDFIDIYIALESVLEIPNAFTPGSDGPNNILHIIRRGQAKLKSFRIYNRWGNEIFKTSDIDEGWNGRYHGIPQPMGVYVYIIEAEYNTGRKYYKQGNVTLIR